MQFSKFMYALANLNLLHWSLQLAIFATAAIETSGSCLPFFALCLAADA
jgi:hypothetical protein